MKKLFIPTLLVMMMTLFLLPSCTKTAGTNMSTPASVYTPIELARDPAFVGLNDALNHFDPHYLQLVYKDQHTTTELQDSSTTLLLHLQADPENRALQQQLADFYKFNSIAELKYYSNQITINATAIKNKYFTQNKTLTDQDVITYFKARSLYAKTKMDSVSNNTNRIKTSSMYEDYVLFPQPPAFMFFGEMDLESTEAGGDIAACKDACCTDYVNCKSQAEKNFFYNTALFVLGSTEVLSVAGGSLGSSLPIIGTFIGARMGATAGSYLGGFIAQRIYFADLNICVINYKSCKK